MKRITVIAAAVLTISSISTLSYKLYGMKQQNLILSKFATEAASANAALFAENRRMQLFIFNTCNTFAYGAYTESENAGEKADIPEKSGA